MPESHPEQSPASTSQNQPANNQFDPDEYAASVSQEATKALMAHTIRAIQNQFHKRGLGLEVLIVYVEQGEEAIFKGNPNKTTLLKMRMIPVPDEEKPYRGRVKAVIRVRKSNQNHHRTRLCIAHELFHVIIALKHYGKTTPPVWDGKWKKEHEPLCNRFAQMLAKKHNEFNDNHHAVRVKFPPEIYAIGFVLDLGDFANLPDCLKHYDP